MKTLFYLITFTVIILKIDFVPIDYAHPRVYGSEEGKKLAILDNARVAFFKNIVNEN